MATFTSIETPPNAFYSVPDTAIIGNLLANFSPYGVLQSNPTGARLANMSGVTLDLNKAKRWMQNWFPCPPYHARSAWDGSSEVMTFVGPWSENWVFRMYMLGWSYNAGNADPTQPGILVREIPAQHFAEPWLYASEAEVVETPGAWIQAPWAKNSDGSPRQDSIAFIDSSAAKVVPVTYADAQTCKVQVTYRKPRYQIRPNNELYGTDGDGNPVQVLNEMSRYLERQASMAVDALPIPAQQQFALVWSQGPPNVINTTVPQGSARILQTIAELTYIWHQVPDIPFQQFMLAAGRVNSVPFDPPQDTGVVPIGGIFLGFDPQGNPINGFPAGTVLCPMQPKYERVDAPNGRTLWDITAKFLVRLNPINPDGTIANQVTGNWATWNTFPIPVGNTVAYFLAGQGGVNGPPLYPSYDLNQIFTQPNPPTYSQGPLG